MSFEMALFRSKNAPPLLVVSNERSDMQCSSYETFFLRRVGNFRIDGGKVSGTFVVGGDGGDTPSNATYEFNGTFNVEHGAGF